MKLKIFHKFLYVFILCIIHTTSAQELIGDHVHDQSKSHQITINSLPSNLPNKVIIPIEHGGKTLSMILEKTSVFGKNTRCLIDDGTGKLIETPMTDERSYLGTVSEYEGYSVSAVLTDQGLIANIYRPNQSTIEIVPSNIDNQKHVVKEVSDAYKCGTNCKIVTSEKSNVDNTLLNNKWIDVEKPEPSNSAIYSGMHTHKTIAIAMQNTAATSRPSRRMEVLEFEIGVEIGSRSFLSNTAYKGNLSTAQASAQSIIGNLNSRFSSATGVRFKLGTVIIRTSANTDPLRNSVTATGAANNASESLRAFGDYWNNNPGVVGNTHDLAVYHVASRPSGLAYVNGVGNTRNRYATMGGNGPTSWANGTAAHEVGHSFGLRHVNQNNFFYEARPRTNSGVNTSGGRNSFFSIMDGRGEHNIGRMATTEAQTVINGLSSKRSVATVINNAGNIPPFGVYDEFDISTSQSSIVLDVIKNDYDANNDVLDVRLLDTKSFKGGNITLSRGTGPGGRNELRYTPPSSNFSGRDFFHYTVFDTGGRTNFGAVYITQTQGFDRNANETTFDFGTASSPIFNNAIRVTNTSNNNDFRWTNTSGLRSADRGGASGVNALNRDFIYSSQPRTFEVNLRNGVWQALITFGDRNFAHDRMVVRTQGESRTRVNNLNTAARQFLNRRFDVEVRNGKLAIEFSDNGGSDPNWVANRLKVTRLRDLPNTNTNAAPIGSVISLRGNNGKYVSSENGASPMNCNRDQVFAWEKFTVVDAGGGKVALRGNNGRYISSENGANPMTCNRTNIGSWEQFTWGTNNGKITLKGNNNQYVSSENGAQPMNCNRGRVGSFERFDINTISSKSSSANSKPNKISIYPNPATNMITIKHIEKGSTILLIDNLGRTISSFVAKSSSQEIDITRLNSGMYFLKINNEKSFQIIKQ